MKNMFFLFALAAIVILSSCKKDEITPATEIATLEVKASSGNPDPQNVEASMTEFTEDVKLLEFRIETEGRSARINNINFTLTSSQKLRNVVSAIKIKVGSDELNGIMAPIPDSKIGHISIREFYPYFTIEKDEIITVKIYVDVNRIDRRYFTIGTTMKASIAPSQVMEIELLDPLSGETLNVEKEGSVDGNEQTFVLPDDDE